jgi:hypothetical protein
MTMQALPGSALEVIETEFFFQDGSVVSSLHCMNDPQPEGHMASYIGRRKFLATLGGAVATWPLAARAQTGKLVRLGYLDGGARTDPTTQNLRRQFVLGMRDLGYNEGRDYLLEERYAAGQLDSFPTYAHENESAP